MIFSLLTPYTLRRSFSMIIFRRSICSLLNAVERLVGRVSGDGNRAQPATIEARPDEKRRERLDSNFLLMRDKQCLQSLSIEPVRSGN